jgi:hypothetical protein
MFTPNSATRLHAVKRSIPGMLCHSITASSKGAMRRSMSSSMHWMHAASARHSSRKLSQQEAVMISHSTFQRQL